jgi:hypothetical protein
VRTALCWCLLAPLLLLGGCASREQIAARQAAARAAINAEDDGKCRSFGALPGSSAYLQCRMTLDQTRTQMEAAQEAQRQEFYSHMLDVGSSMMTGH